MIKNLVIFLFNCMIIFSARADFNYELSRIDHENFSKQTISNLPSYCSGYPIIICELVVKETVCVPGDKYLPPRCNSSEYLKYMDMQFYGERVKEIRFFPKYKVNGLLGMMVSGIDIGKNNWDEFSEKISKDYGSYKESLKESEDKVEIKRIWVKNKTQIICSRNDDKGVGDYGYRGLIAAKKYFSLCTLSYVYNKKYDTQSSD